VCRHRRDRTDWAGVVEWLERRQRRDVGYHEAETGLAIGGARWASATSRIRRSAPGRAGTRAAGRAVPRRRRCRPHARPGRAGRRREQHRSYRWNPRGAGRTQAAIEEMAVGVASVRHVRDSSTAATQIRRPMVHRSCSAGPSWPASRGASCSRSRMDRVTATIGPAHCLAPPGVTSARGAVAAWLGCGKRRRHAGRQMPPQQCEDVRPATDAETSTRLNAARARATRRTSIGAAARSPSARSARWGVRLPLGQ
jgi:hypothetical protein